MNKLAAKDRPRLGRGLASLIAVTQPRKDHPLHLPPHDGAQVSITPPVPPVVAVGAHAEPPATVTIAAPLEFAGGRAVDIPVDAISPNPHQPRRDFDEGSLKERAQSMKANGIIQPILVRPAGPGNDGKYQLIAGERRWRAAQLAGIAAIPAIVRDVDAVAQAQLAMIENIQREDLNPIDRALGYQVLVKELGLTQAELAGRLGEDRSSIANFLRLLELNETTKEMVRCGKLTVGHAKLLAGVSDILRQQKLAELTVSQGLSVRNLERILQEQAADQQPKVRAALSPHMQDVEKTLCRQLGLRVQLRAARERGKGRLVIHYSSLDQFDQIIDRLGVNLATD
jgi:ParB family transcriptional regulator, chromosome partitioning protein